MTLLALLAPAYAALNAGFGDLDGQQPYQYGCDADPIVNTTPFAVGAEARRSFARTYSAVAVLERDVLPFVTGPQADEQETVLHLGWDALFGVASLPAYACGEVGLMGYDVSAYNMVLAHKTGRLTLFYSAAGNSSVIYEEWAGRTTKHLGGMVVGHFYAFTAPLWGNRTINADDLDDSVLTQSFADLAEGDQALGGVSLDYVAGASFDAGYLLLGAGYVGSKGLYLRAVQPQSSLFLDTVSELEGIGEAEPADLLRYLSTGLDALRILRGGSATDAVFSRYRVVSPTGVVFGAEDSEGEAAAEPDEVFSMTTLRQRDMRGGRLDVSASYAIQPDPAFYEASLRIHSRGFHPDLAQQPANAYSGGSSSEVEAAGGIAVGVVQLPERTWFAVTGGTKPYLAAEGVAYHDGGEGGYTRAQLLVNDPDTLTIFPYAQGAWKFHISTTLRM